MFFPRLESNGEQNVFPWCGQMSQPYSTVTAKLFRGKKEDSFAAVSLEFQHFLFEQLKFNLKFMATKFTLKEIFFILPILLSVYYNFSCINIYCFV